MVSLRIIISVALLLFASFVGQVYPTACFKCEHHSLTNIDEACRDNPQQYKYLDDCYFHSTGGRASKADKEMISFKCAMVKSSNMTAERVERMCIPSYITCDLLQTKKDYEKMKIELCTICDDDLCNSSSKAGIAIFTLISCLLSYVIFK